MTKAQEVAILQQAAALAESISGAEDSITGINDAVKAVGALLTATLPVKADGSVFTADDVHQARLAADAPFDRVIDRDNPNPSQPS